MARLRHEYKCGLLLGKARIKENKVVSRLLQRPILLSKHLQRFHNTTLVNGPLSFLVIIGVLGCKPVLCKLILVNT